MSYRVIITGATGMVGEGVLLECLAHPEIAAVLSVSRRPSGHAHPKLKEYLVPDFLALRPDDAQLQGYDACFFCAGVSSVGLKEAAYRKATYDTTLHFAASVLPQNPGMIFIYVSGAGTDSSEQGRLMWARVKGRTENDLARLPFRKVYLFRPGFLKGTPGQQHTLRLYKYLGWLYPFLKAVLPRATSTLQQVGQAMIRCVTHGTDRQILEVPDINRLGSGAAG